MSTQVAARRAAGDVVRASDPRSASDLVKFTAMAALLAIFADAAVAHAIFWANDPYWTYWVTDTLLMATVFGLGTAWFGIGAGRGAALTAVHILLLTGYYWTLSPIGLPGHAEWLDLERTWITGLPVHFGVYYLGYLVAVWLWRRRDAVRDLPATARVTGLATLAVATAAGIVIVLGMGQWLVTGTFPGLTWFIVRVAVAAPFVFGWWALAGRDRAAALSGGVVIAFLLATYGHFVSPAGLPDPSLRLLQPDPPSAIVHWLSYRQEFLVLLPLTLATCVAAFVLAACWCPVARSGAPATVGRAVPMAALAALVVVGLLVAPHTGPEAHAATVDSQGTATVAFGQDRAAPAAGDAVLRMTVQNRNSHRTPLPPHDLVDIEATVASADGGALAIRATQPMVADPRGRFTTWRGVGLDKWHHGRSRIGSSSHPPVRSDVAVYALGSVSGNGAALATDVPVHVFTDPARGTLELAVGDPDVPNPALPGGSLHVVWSAYRGGHGRTLTNARYALGGSVLLLLLCWAVAGVRRQTRDFRQAD